MQRKILSTIILIATTLSWASGAVEWHNGRDGTKYLIDFDNRYHWFDAWNQCAFRNLQLVVIDTKEKNDVIVELLTRIYGKPINLWIGAHDDLGKDLATRGFTWMPTGQRFTFTYWLPGQPNYVDQQCVHIDVDSKKYEWNDMRCNAAFGFICEENKLVIQHRKDLSDKSAKIDQANAGVEEYNKKDQQNKASVNSRTDNEIKEIQLNLQNDIEQLQANANDKIIKIDQDRKMEVHNLDDKLTKELNNNRKNVQNILNA